MRDYPKLLSGLAAVAIYFGIISLVFYYFGYRSHLPPKHYVAKNSKSIAVSLASPKQSNNPHKPAAKTHESPPKPLPKKPRHSKPKAIVAKKPLPVPSKPKPKPKAAKKIKPKSLFAHVKTSPRPKKSVKEPVQKTPSKLSHSSAKASKASREALKKQQEHDRGIENRYLAKIQNKLYGWPSQSNFAGAKITIGLTIHPNGDFEYVILTPTSNVEFDRTIRRYLSQLKSIGFEPTPKGKQYKFKVEIVAK